MSLLDDEETSEIARQRESVRLTNVSSKLTRSEPERLDDLGKTNLTRCCFNGARSIYSVPAPSGRICSQSDGRKIQAINLLQANSTLPHGS